MLASRLLSIVLGLVCLHGGLAHATTLSPGDSGSPDVFTNIITGTAAATDFTFSTVSSGSLGGINLREAVYADPNNVFGAGKLDFLFQIQSGSGSSANETITLVTTSSFTGFSTDVGYTTFTAKCIGGLPSLPCAFNPDQFFAPTFVSRSSNGSTVSFTTAIGNYPPASAIFVVETNATSYSTGGSVTASGATSSVTFAAFQPSGAASVPEPASIALLVLGFAGVSLFATRQRKHP